MSASPGPAQQHQIRVAARADERKGAEEAVGREVVAGRHELALVPRALVCGQAPPGRVDLQERELDEVSVHASKVIVAPRAPGLRPP